MYLKALEIQGFKSFPDKTVLNFGEDITAIVGPNGSGKSNISDAIRWVMGEQNSRQLRGAKMEDVIFGGTEKRSQMGFAQVTLVIDNTEHIFPTRDEAEVAVTRRYYRSGESEYYINRQSVRLKDVNELFMDTGMGREGYSIIGQGKIDEILSVKSGERREVFEEAAGISKYRHRKEESERKLERTQENLVRINDKIAELELQVEPLRRQAETAKKYLVLRDELRVLEISVWLENLQALKTGALKLRTDFEAAQADKNRAQDALDAVYAAAEELRRADARVRRAGRAAAQRDGRAREQAARAGIGDRRAAHGRSRTTRSRSTARGASWTIAGTRRRAAEPDGRARGAARRRSSGRRCRCRRSLTDGSPARRSWRQLAGSAAQEAEALRAKEALSASRPRMRAPSSPRCRRAWTAALSAPHGHRAGARCSGGKAGAGAARSEGEPPCRCARRRRTSRPPRISFRGTACAWRAAGSRADETQQEKLRLTMALKTLTDRIALLGEMEKEYEGFSQRGEARDARRREGCAARDPRPGGEPDGDGSGLSPSRWRLRSAAGCRTSSSGAKATRRAPSQLLKQRDGGRATFLPVSTVRGNALREQGLEQETGFVGIASRAGAL